MSNRISISSGSPFEDVFGYCRAVKTGNLLEISGTVALVDGDKVKEDDLYAQTYNIIERIAVVLEEAGSSINDVVRTRIFTTDISKNLDIAKAHAHFFGAIKPTTGIYEISALIAPQYKVEIEFTAWVNE
ncbi:RidA family protein [Cytophagaceae bacterium 50C-KIRBA]|uniref:RidA family protein n=1 Tax=Aquirufa beregesia TaxID=2516556 RepID=A0ABX0EZ02_9BACT|nr:RidA family protein [Aquirufa beregesia]NGZ44847.1 RidA family protein [Aquirufa beregesia]